MKMETVAIVLAIFGCGEDFKDCTKVDMPGMQFASRSECVRQIDEVLNQRTDLSFPIITARCQPLQGEALIAAAQSLVTENTAIR